ncbi:hypothetical protein D3C72_743010 [compost metagenome]
MAMKVEKELKETFGDQVAEITLLDGTTFVQIYSLQGDRAWHVTRGGRVLNTFGFFEAVPSQSTPDYIQRTHFESLEVALKHWQRAMAEQV